MSGVSGWRARIRPAISSTFFKVVPAARATCPACWITGPSAIGSEKGTPSSTISAPASIRRSISASFSSGVGQPTVA